MIQLIHFCLLYRHFSSSFFSFHHLLCSLLIHSCHFSLLYRHFSSSFFSFHHLLCSLLIHSCHFSLLYRCFSSSSSSSSYRRNLLIRSCHFSRCFFSPFFSLSETARCQSCSARLARPTCRSTQCCCLSVVEKDLSRWKDQLFHSCSQRGTCFLRGLLVRMLASLPWAGSLLSLQELLTLAAC